MASARSAIGVVRSRERWLPQFRACDSNDEQRPDELLASLATGQPSPSPSPSPKQMMRTSTQSRLARLPAAATRCQRSSP